ncbi:tetratricopeptide repeat protein [Streptomyces cucumeris]|uniref:tetratricopeptide repeat protein n=1 Tax=Streptomyces cucumeris TaxID=2962890 RepID=UPI003D718687
MTDRVLELLRTRPELAEPAAFPFGFDVHRAYHGEAVHLASGASLEPIAGDDSGGTYFLSGGTAVLHASSDGAASLFADSVGEALEILVRLPRWCETLATGPAEEELRAAIRTADQQAREEFVPDLDARRAALIEGLGLPDRPLVELLARSESATRRTEPDHLLLNSRDLYAYRLDASFRQPLRDLVLGPGRETLERLRSGDPGAREEAAGDPGLRAGVLRAARYDRRDGDLPLLRFLLEREAAERSEWYEERRLAAALVAAHGLDEDVPLLRSVTTGQITDTAEAVEWAARAVAAESEFTWIELAHRQGRIEHARVTLIRLLDATGPDPDRLRTLSEALERLGDHAQAARAQISFLSLQDTARDRASAAYVLARLERRKGDLDAAAHALERARAAVGAGGTPPDGTVGEWHRRGLGRLITEQHLELVLAAVEAGDTDLARTTMAHGRLLLKVIAKGWAKELSPLSTRAKWAVAGLRASGGGP